MSETEIIDVAVMPPKTLEADLINKVAGIINRDSNWTRLLLTGKSPKIIARYANLSAAESTLQNLRKQGIEAISFKDTLLHSHSPIFRAHSLQFEPDKILFKGKNGKICTLDSLNARLIIKGRMGTDTETEVITNKKKFSLSGTLLTGGLPVFRNVKVKSSVTSHENELFLIIFESESAEPAVEIWQHEFDYSGLGAEMAPSTQINFNTLIKKICTVFNQAFYDDSLTEVGRGNAATPQENVYANCKLIYLFHPKPNP